MPIYEYKCRGCGEVMEVFTKNQAEAVKCPHCGSEEMEKLFSSSYMIRMGSSSPGRTCCGREERCDTPPCSDGGVCRRR
jgi:putative FmdB family regulatory protein